MAGKRVSLDQMKVALQQQEKDAQQEVALKNALPNTADPAPVASAQAIVRVPLDAIAPNRVNPRKNLGELDELAGSIKEQGILQPITVRPLRDGESEHYPEGTRYVLLMGERRWAASQLADLQTVPVIVRDDLTPMERQVMVLENVMRKELTPVEEAKAFAELIDTGLSQREVARQLHLTQAHVSRRVALLSLVPGLLSFVEDGKIGPDIATNEIAKLGEAAQLYLLDQLTLDDESPLDITPDRVRAHMAQAVAEADRLERINNQRHWLSERNITIYDDATAMRSELQAKNKRHTYLGSANEVDDLTGVVGVINPVSSEADLYLVADPAPVPVLAAPAPKKEHDADRSEERDGAQDDAPLDGQDVPHVQVEQAQQDHDLFGAPVVKHNLPLGDDPRRMKHLRQAIAAWTEANPKPPKGSALTQRLAEYLVETAGRDLTWTVCKWLSPRGIGCEVEGINDWYEWRGSIEPKDNLTVAWFLLVASDLQGAGYVNHGDAWERTRERVAQVAPELLDELGMTSDTKEN